MYLNYMFRNLNLIMCFIISNSVFSQQDFNISINLNNVDSVTLFQSNLTENELIIVTRDTNLFFDTTLSNLFHVIYNKKKHYFYLNNATNLSLSIINNDSVFFSGENADFSFFLNEYFAMQNQIKSLFDQSNLDLFEVSLYNLISNDFVSFFQTHKFYEKFSPYCRKFFKNFLELEYFNAIGHYLINYQKDTNALIPSYRDIQTDLLDLHIFKKAVNNTSFYNVNVFQNYIYNSIILFSIYNQKYQFNQEYQNFHAFSVHVLDFLNMYVPKDIWIGFVNYYLHKFWNVLDDHTCFYFSSYLNNHGFQSEITDLMFKDFYDRKKVANVQNDENEKNTFSPFFMESISGDQSSLNQFKGKFLYVDIWASWCGPCRKQFPHAEKLKRKFTKRQLKKLEFIYISIDNDKEKWKESINLLGLRGHHFISPSNESNSASKYFEISSIPRYILINKDGEVIDNNAKRPSDESLFNDLLNLVK